jgi:hypothetical protein
MIFLLGVAAGLRRKEIDLLEWSAFRFQGERNSGRANPILSYKVSRFDS